MPVSTLVWDVVASLEVPHVADVIRETATHVVIGIRFSRGDFERLVEGYPTRGQALRALRLLVEDALALASSDVAGSALSVAKHGPDTLDEARASR